MSVKNTLLASYAAVQHIAWDVMDVMTIQVGFAWPIGENKLQPSNCVSQLRDVK
jgi:hypothetical protein